MLFSQIPANPLLPKGFGLLFLRTNRRHRGNIMIFKGSDRHLHRRFVWLGIPAGIKREKVYG
jgi:hypothetical protein